MSVANELSSEVAAAIMEAGEDHETRTRLTEVVFKFHSTMRELKAITRQRQSSVADQKPSDIPED